MARYKNSPGFSPPFRAIILRFNPLPFCREQRTKTLPHLIPSLPFCTETLPLIFICVSYHTRPSDKVYPMYFLLLFLKNTDRWNSERLLGCTPPTYRGISPSQDIKELFLWGLLQRENLHPFRNLFFGR
jgi:hypothetical protein